MGSLTRDAIQGFIDGYLAMKGDPTNLAKDIASWMKAHPQYPLSDSEVATILDDLASYRGV